MYFTYLLCLLSVSFHQNINYIGGESFTYLVTSTCQGPVTFFIIVKMVLYIVKVPEHISLNNKKTEINNKGSFLNYL